MNLKPGQFVNWMNLKPGQFVNWMNLKPGQFVNCPYPAVLTRLPRKSASAAFKLSSSSAGT
jgi:hypothetical protein